MKFGWIRYAALITAFLTGAAVLTVWATTAQDPMKAFQARIMDYVALHKKAAGSIPSVPKNVTDPTIIAQYEQKLTQAIRLLRPKAKQGDIFTPDAQKMVVKIIKTRLDGNAKSTILGDGNPKSPESAAPVNLAVNAVYPPSAPVSTMPPSLLMALPTLPPEVEFRFVGQTLILRDVQANMIVDLMPNAIKR
jgi:hypothetical protein